MGRIIFINTHNDIFAKNNRKMVSGVDRMRTWRMIRIRCGR